MMPGKPHIGTIANVTHPDAIMQAKLALGHQLAAYRRAAGVTQHELAPRVHYGRSTIANVEIGRQNVPRAFWEHADDCLSANGDLVRAFDQIEALRRQQHDRAVESARIDRFGYPSDSAPTITKTRDSSAATGESPDVTGPWEPHQTVAEIGVFTVRDMTYGRRDAAKALAALLLGASLTEPLEQWVNSTSRPIGASDRSGVGEEELRHLEASARAMRQSDTRYRLGIRRKAVIGQLNEVAELTRDSRQPRITRRLFTMLTELSEVAASMSYDAGLHPIAQRYYLYALRASYHTGDKLVGANILANMARQLLDLDHPTAALELIRLALDGTQGPSHHRVQAILRTREAWAYAQLHRAQAFHRAVGQAKESFANSSHDDHTPPWIANFDEAELHGVIGARYRDLARHDPSHAHRAVANIQHAIAIRHPRRVRNRAFDTIGLGRTYLLMGEPEEACTLARAALHLADGLGSGRVTARLKDFYHETEPYAHNRAVTEFRLELRDRLAAPTH